MSWESIRIVLPCFWALLAFLLVYSVVPTSLAVFKKNNGDVFKQMYVESSAVCVLPLSDSVF